MECGDILEFQDYLKKSRDFDDKFIYMLNATLPTDSFRSHMDLPARCKDLYLKLDDNFQRRESSIQHCLTELHSRIQKLQSEQSRDNNEVISKQIRKEQTNARLLRNELDVEQVIKERSLKLFNEKCRSFYKPPSLPL